MIFGIVYKQLYSSSINRNTISFKAYALLLQWCNQVRQAIKLNNTITGTKAYISVKPYNDKSQQLKIIWHST